MIEQMVLLALDDMDKLVTSSSIKSSGYGGARVTLNRGSIIALQASMSAVCWILNPSLACHIANYNSILKISTYLKLKMIKSVEWLYKKYLRNVLPKINIADILC